MLPPQHSSLHRFVFFEIIDNVCCCTACISCDDPMILQTTCSYIDSEHFFDAWNAVCVEKLGHFEIDRINFDENGKHNQFL